MNTRVIGFVLLTCLSSPGLALGQPPAAVDRERSTVTFVGHIELAEVQTDREQKMSEDIEIMRRILSRALHSHTGTPITQRGREGEVGAEDQASLVAGLLLDVGRPATGELDSPLIQALTAPRADSCQSCHQVGTDAHRVHWYPAADGAVRLWEAATDAQPKAAATSPDGVWHRRAALRGWLADPHGAVRFLPTIEGTYLRGYGVHYSIVSILPCPEPRAESAQAARRSISEWERVRKELLGEKVAPDEKPVAAKQPAVEDVILRILAENGRNFARLGPNEHVAVSVTFRNPGPRTGTPLSRVEQPQPESPPPAQQSNLKDTPSTPAITDATAGKPPPKTKDEASPVPEGDTALMLLGRIQRLQQARSVIENYVLLGDLHMKQGRYKEAEAAYRKAAETQPTAEVFRKIAQANLALSETENQQQQLKRALESLTRAVGKIEEAKSLAEAPKVTLPPKLIISAPKKLLDQLGTGKMTFDDFKKSASVQYLNFASSEKGSSKSPSGGAKDHK